VQDEDDLLAVHEALDELAALHAINWVQRESAK